MSKIRVAVAGGTGYMGVELLRLLARHPRVELARVTSEQYAGKRLAEVYPALRGRLDLRLEELDRAALAEGVDVVFSALPHGAAAATIVEALEAGRQWSSISARTSVCVIRRSSSAGTATHPAPELWPRRSTGFPSSPASGAPGAARGRARVLPDGRTARVWCHSSGRAWSAKARS